MAVKTYSQEFAGRTLSVELGKLAGQANGSCRVQYGETSVLVTATMGRPKSVDYFPLTVEYEEKYYAAGKIKGSKWIKRETRPSEEAILTGRMIDRTLRPRFDHRVRNEVQVVVTVLSFDGINDPDMLGLFGASLALMVSDIPFDGPVAGVRVGRVNGSVIINPTYLERQGDYDIAVAGTAKKINMIEAGAKIVPEADIVAAIAAGAKRLKELADYQIAIAKEVGKPKQELKLFEFDKDLATLISEYAAPLLDPRGGGGLYTPDKQTFYKNLHAAHDRTLQFIAEKFPDDKDKNAQAEALFEEEINRVVHRNIMQKDRRPDGRKLDQVRELGAEVGILPRCHGSGLFNRGATQALSILTLAAPGMEQWMETMEIELTKKRFMHHYVFPPFSVGEVGRLGSPGRREIGHGALAERSLEPIIPSKEEFPYTIRVVSEILASNGSSSMASVCGSSLALMDGGVPIKTPAAGIAMGLMFDEDGDKYKVLTDIQGPEDHHGDMDMKVAGTKDGITGMQMDVKVEGITEEILAKAVAQARKARLEILEVLTTAIASPRPELSSHAPRVETIKINPEKIGALIGPGGKMINSIIEQTGADIDIEDDGTVFVTAASPESMEKTKALVQQIAYEPKVGDRFEGTVVRLMDFGAFVEFVPGQDGLVHVSEISTQHVRRPGDVLKIGQKVNVTIKNIDDLGRTNLTMLAPGQKKESFGQDDFGPRPSRDKRL